MKKILILGGGFAGVKAAIALQKSKQFEVTLVSERDYLYLYPISIWIPTRTIEPDEAKVSLHKIHKKYGFNMLIDSVKEIRPNNNEVELNTQTLAYDYLIIATGAAKMQPQGVEHTHTICGSPAQTIDYRDKFDALIAQGSGKIAIGFGGNPKDKSAVRGGPAFEMIFNIDLYLRRKGLRDKFELTMFAPMEEPGARMGKSAMSAMKKMFAKRNIGTRYGQKITSFLPDAVVFEDESRLASDLIMFISAGTGTSLLKNSGLAISETGFVTINNHNQSVSHVNVFAVGDAAAYEGPEWKAKQGHIAEIMATNAAHNILEIEKGTHNFKTYMDKLHILCIMDMGNGAAFVYRDSKHEIMIPLPIVGHWLKKAWGWYAKFSKVGLGNL